MAQPIPIENACSVHLTKVWPTIMWLLLLSSREAFNLDEAIDVKAWQISVENKVGRYASKASTIFNLKRLAIQCRCDENHVILPDGQRAIINRHTRDKGSLTANQRWCRVNLE